jgi:hypothetical protein
MDAELVEKVECRYNFLNLKILDIVLSACIVLLQLIMHYAA